MEQKRLFAKTLPVFLVFYVMGFIDIVGVATSYVKLEFEISNTLTQILTMMTFVWFVLLSIPVGVFQDKKGKKFTLTAGVLFTATGMLIPAVAYNFPGMLISFILLGIGNTIIQVSASPLMQDVSSPGKLPRNLTLSQFIKAIAGLLGPFIATFCAIRFGNWTIVYWIYLAICLLTIFWLRATFIAETDAGGRASIGSALKLLRDRKVALLVSGTFLMVGFDVGMNTNIINYLKETFAVSQEEAGAGIGIYFTGLMTGRFLSVLLLNKIHGNKVLLYNILLSLLAFASLYFIPDLVSGEAVIFLIGLFTAAIFPLIFSAGLQYLPERSNELSGLITMSICGGGIIPPLTGIVSDHFGLMNGLIILGVCLLYVVFLAIYIIRTK
jgi:fucose permease